MKQIKLLFKCTWLLLLMQTLYVTASAQTVTMYFPSFGGIDNCANPLPNAGTYTVTGTFNGRNEYTKPGGNPRIRWTGSQWEWQADDPTIGGVNFLTAWYNTNNTTTLPADCWQASFGCFLPAFSGAVNPVVNLSNLSISPSATNVAGSGTADFTATFGSTISGLTTSNFSLNTSANITSATIASVTVVSPTVLTITVNNITGYGTISVSLANLTGSGAVPCGTLPFQGSTYTIPNPSAQSLPITGSCIIGTPLLVEGGDPNFATWNGRPVYYNPSITINYQGSTVTTDIYLVWELAGYHPALTQDGWSVEFGYFSWATSYYSFSNTPTGALGVYTNVNPNATPTNCGGTVTIGSVCATPTAYNVTGGGAYCAGGTGVAVGLADSETGVTYQLKNGGVNAGSPISGTTGSTISFGNQTAAGTYTVEATRTSGGCTNTMTGSVAISISPNVGTPTFTSAIGTLCVGNTTTYTATASNSSSISYSILSGGASINSSTGDVTNVTSNFTIRATASGLCGPSTFADYAVTVNSFPSITSVSYNTPLCVGANLVLNVAATGTGPFNYAWSGAGSFSSTTVANPTVTSPTASNYVVNVSNNCGNAQSSVTVVINNYDPTPVFTLGATSTRCQVVETVNYSTTMPSTYSLTGGSPSTINSATGNLSWSAAFSGTATITATSTGVCPSTATHTVTVAPATAAPTITNSGASSVCAGGSITLTGAGTAGPATEYAWTKNGAFAFYSNSSANYTFPASPGTNNYSLVVIYSGCPSAPSANFPIVGVEPVAVITPSIAPPYCIGNPPVLNATPPTGTGYTYSWICPTCSTTTNGPTYTPAGGGNHRVIITDINGCTKSSAWTNIVLNSIPTANAGADKSLCVNGSTTIGISPVAGISYLWTPTTNLSSATVANPTVTPNTLGMTTYTLTITKTSTGCSSSDMVNVTALTLPATPTLSGTTSPVCQGGSITLTPSNVTGPINWYKNNVFSSTSATPNNLTLTAPVAATNYTITAVNGACNSAPSNPVSVQIHPAPTPTISANPTAVSFVSSVCNPGQTSGTALLTAGIPAGAPAVTSYNWQRVISGIASNVSPAVTTNTYTASVASTPTSQNNKLFRSQITYSNGCVRNTTTMKVVMLAPTCTIRMGQDYDAKEEIFTVYPNPTENVINVSIQNASVSEGELILYNTLGQVVSARNISLVEGNSEEILDLSSLPAGFYTLSFQTTEGNQIQKIVKE